MKWYKGIKSMVFNFKPLEKIPEIILIEPKVFGDERGWFLNMYVESEFKKHGIDFKFKQVSSSFSQKKGTLRGLHYQNLPFSQGKLVQCLAGEIFDVGVDIRESSPTYGKWGGVRLTAESKNLLWLPPGFAHGFCTLTDDVRVIYFMDNEYHPEKEGTICWSDPEIKIDWPIENPILSDKDADAPLLRDATIKFS